jgi:hypothetical protein
MFATQQINKMKICKKYEINYLINKPKSWLIAHINVLTTANSGKNLHFTSSSPVDYRMYSSNIHEGEAYYLAQNACLKIYPDINGDGLPDRILYNKQVQLNLGYSFAEPTDWDLNNLESGKTTTVNAEMGYDFGGSSFSAGFGLTTAFSNTNYSFIDLNSDGLPDKVRRQDDDIYVSLNNGIGFEAKIRWDKLSSIRKSSSTAGMNVMSVNFLDSERLLRKILILAITALFIAKQFSNTTLAVFITLEIC